MAYITHTSTGAKNSPRQLAVNGILIEMPHKNNIWLDLQPDYKLVSSAGFLQTWKDSIHETLLIPGEASYPPPMDNAHKLLDYPTISFATGTYPHFPTIKLLGSSNAPSTDLFAGKMAHCTLFYSPGVVTNGNISLISRYFSTGEEFYAMPYLSNGKIRVSLGRPTRESFEIGTPQAGWNILIVYLDLTAHTCATYLNGAYTTRPYTVSVGGYIDTIKFGDINQKTNLSIGALISWYAVALLQSDCVAIKDYLFDKYGLV